MVGSVVSSETTVIVSTCVAFTYENVTVAPSGGTVKGMLAPLKRAAGAVVDVPALVDRGLGLVVAGRDDVGGEGVGAVAV